MQWNVAEWRHWGLGIVGSWMVTWLLAPWLLDSILVRVADPILNVATLQPGRVVRWRSEGCGDTTIGPHGLPGWQPRPRSERIILWGDSQVEGLCVNDAEKISNQVIAIANSQSLSPLDCLSLGRSGADAREWQDLMAAAEALWQPVLHVWVVTELSDLLVLAPEFGSQVPPREVTPSPGWVKLAAAVRAEALFTAAKRILRDPHSGGLRRLDFRVGPRETSSLEHRAYVVANEQQNRQWADTVAAAVSELERQFPQRLVLVYAPGTPTLSRPMLSEHPDDALFELISERLLANGVETVDLRPAFLHLWQTRRRLPRGFHNGFPGSGHLNADGNRLIAEAIVSLAQPRLSRPVSTVAETASR